METLSSSSAVAVVRHGVALPLDDRRAWRGRSRDVRLGRRRRRVGGGAAVTVGSLGGGEHTRTEGGRE